MFLFPALAAAAVVGQSGDPPAFEREAVAADDECAAAGCALNALQLRVGTRADQEAIWDKNEASSALQERESAIVGQVPSDIDGDLAQAEQGLGSLPSDVASEVGGDLQEVGKDWQDAQEHEKEFQADQAKLEDIYKQTEAEEAQWNKQEAQWDQDAPSALQLRGAEGQAPSDID